MLIGRLIAQMYQTVMERDLQTIKDLLETSIARLLSGNDLIFSLILFLNIFQILCRDGSVLVDDSFKSTYHSCRADELQLQQKIHYLAHFYPHVRFICRDQRPTFHLKHIAG